MLQHEMLIFLTAPLALLSAPWMPMWRGVPLSWRRAVLGRIARNRAIFPAVHRISRVIGAPLFAWLFYVIDLSFWHIPAIYDLTEASDAIHYTEHALFLITALLFWGQIIPSFPFRPRQRYVQQVIYVFAATMHGNLLDWFLMSATTPIYPYYAALPRTPDMISAVVDEHIASAIMMTGSLVAFVTLLMVIAGLWLLEEERRSEAFNAKLLAQHP
jgi:cytochrome c oxidase assembly factor CtaG